MRLWENWQNLNTNKSQDWDFDLWSFHFLSSGSGLKISLIFLIFWQRPLLHSLLLGNCSLIFPMHIDQPSISYYLKFVSPFFFINIMLILSICNFISTEKLLQNKRLDDTSGSGLPTNPGYENICIVATMSIWDVVDHDAESSCAESLSGHNTQANDDQHRTCFELWALKQKAFQYSWHRYVKCPFLRLSTNVE